MPLYLDTRGKTVASVAVCDRCKLKMALADMIHDPNVPGVRGHPHCMDQFDPWRLPARQPDKIDVRYPRPDTPLGGFDESFIDFYSDNGPIYFTGSSTQPILFEVDD